MTAFTPESNPPENTIKAQVMPEIIRALTPILLAAMGGTLVIFALVTKNGVVDAGIFTVATSAFSGAAGLAQPGKSKSDSSS